MRTDRGGCGILNFPNSKCSMILVGNSAETMNANSYLHMCNMSFGGREGDMKIVLALTLMRLLLNL